MLENLSTLERIDAALQLLDQTVDSKGRERCAQICIIGDVFESVKKDYLELTKQLKVIPEEETAAEQPKPE